MCHVSWQTSKASIFCKFEEGGTGRHVQLEERDAEVAQLRAERGSVEGAVEEMRLMLMQSLAERGRLAAEGDAAEQRLRLCQEVPQNLRPGIICHPIP